VNNEALAFRGIGIEGILSFFLADYSLAQTWQGKPSI
jgi:hypothetical protein